jgi:TonB family protein
MADTVEQAYLESCRKGPDVPVPSAVVAPRVQSCFIGQTVEVEFTVDAYGKPSNFSVLNFADGYLAETVVDALKQWQFTPAHRAGVPVAEKVILPVHVVDGPAAGEGYAAN